VEVSDPTKVAEAAATLEEVLTLLPDPVVPQVLIVYTASFDGALSRPVVS